MQIIIRYENGRTAEALLLAAGKDRMRLAIAGQPDIVELLQTSGCWYAEDGVAVEVEALIASADYAAFWADLCPRTMTAGHTLVD